MTLSCSLSSLTQSFAPHKSAASGAICFGTTVKVAHFCFDSASNNRLETGAAAVNVSMIFQKKRSLIMMEVNQEVTRERAGIGRSVGFG